jgi:DNA recombination protein RmuC
MLTSFLTFLFGLAAGSLFIWLIFRSQMNEARKDKGEAIAENRALREQLQSELTNRAAAEAKATRVPELESEKTVLNETVDELQGQILSLTSALSRSQTKSEEERKAAEEKLALLNAAREELANHFTNVANRVFDEKSDRFKQDNAASINVLLEPFGKQIEAFEKRVNEVYGSESRERFSLEREVRKLADLNVQISQDAINLTNALKGQTQVQGDLGQMILETVLERSGLVKDREYVIQKSFMNDEGKRRQPDVIVYLPENRQLIIDSKVNLPTYQEYCRLGDGPERDLVLKKHITAFRKHVADLEDRRYQDLYKLNSLDFVLMFVPYEGAFSIAMQGDDALFNYAFERNIVIVTPFTLCATIRTIANVWKQEYQSKNAFQIAKQAGRLHDKFVAFFEDLKDIGTKLNAAQESYDRAQNKLISGRGNIINRIGTLKLLGARARKKLPQEFIDEAMDDDNGVEATVTLEKSQPPLLDPELSKEDSMPLLNSKSVGAGES